MNTNFVINIGRELGSGGREIGAELAKRLGISYYDKELINIASKESGLSKHLFEEADEKTGFSFTGGGLIGMRSSFMSDGFVDNYLGNESLFKIQSDVIRELAEKQSCVFVGRCADYILRDHPHALNVFISAPLPDRIRRVSKNHELTDKKAKDFIEKTDKKRAGYYNYYSNKRWGAATSYHLCINSSIGVNETVDFILRFLEVYLSKK